MAEYLPKDWRDRITIDQSTGDLERQEEALYLSAKSGSLFEPDMTDQEWGKFCEAAELEEFERRAGVPKKLSSLTTEQKEILSKGGESVKSAGVRKIIKKREELIKRLRPQCVDTNDAAFEDEILKETGLTEEEFKTVDTSLGKISETEWKQLEEDADGDKG